MKAQFLFLVVVCLTQRAIAQYQYQPPIALEDGWSTTDLRQKGIDTTLLYRFFNQLKPAPHQLHSILVIQDNELLLEEYFGAYSLNTPHDLRSVTKSITAILMGIAIDQGLVQSLDDPVQTYFKDDPRFVNHPTITIRHLLTMSTGLDCNDWDTKSKGQEDRVYKKCDWLRYFWNLPALHPPGEVAHYCTMGQVVAMELLQRAAQMPIDVFAQRYLFDPLGIKEVRWQHTSRRKTVLATAKRLHLTPRALAKIGQLLLQKGQWKGQSIVSAEWLSTMTTPQVTITGLEYGLLWWQIPLATAQQQHTLLAATGNGGQYLLVVPELDLVVVFTGGAYNSAEDKLPFEVMRKVVLPLFEES